MKVFLSLLLFALTATVAAAQELPEVTVSVWTPEGTGYTSVITREYNGPILHVSEGIFAFCTGAEITADGCMQVGAGQTVVADGPTFLRVPESEAVCPRSETEAVPPPTNAQWCGH